MGDSETVVAQTSSVMGYTSSGYTDVGANIVHEAGTLPSVSSGGISTSAVPTDVPHSVSSSSTLGDGIAYNMDSDSLMQESHVGTANEAKTAVGAINSSGNDAAVENEAINSSQTAGYGSTVNGTGVSAEGAITSVDNGDASGGVSGAVHEQHYMDGSGICLYIILI